MVVVLVSSFFGVDVWVLGVGEGEDLRVDLVGAVAALAVVLIVPSGGVNALNGSGALRFLLVVGTVVFSFAPVNPAILRCSYAEANR